MAEQPAGPGGASRGTYPRTAEATLRLEDGRIVVRSGPDGGDIVRVGNGGVIRWSSEPPIRWWALVMKGETPFDGHEGWAGSNQGKHGVTRIRPDANGGSVQRYAFAVVVSDGRQVVFRDPEVEVGPVQEDDGP